MEVGAQPEAPRPHPGTPRTVLVTGGSNGIGAEIVRALAARGSNVGCGYRHGADRAAGLAEELGGHVFPVRYELGSEKAAQQAIAAVVERFGALHAVVLNAGVWDGGPLEALEHDRWWNVIHQNISSLAHVSRAALPHLRGATDASILMMSSVVGLIGHAGDTAYAGTKAAMVGFARSLAKEVARDGVRVNVVAPGFVDTDMTSTVPARARERIQARALLGRFATATEIARAAVFLSEEATY